MTEEIWEALIMCTIAAENSDNSMSGEQTRKARLANDWLLANYPEFD